MADEYGYFNVSVGWYNPEEEGHPFHPLSGLAYEVYYHRKGNKTAKRIAKGYLDENGKATIEEKASRYRVFDKDTSFVTYIYSKTEDSKVFWRRTENGVDNVSEHYFYTQCSGKTTTTTRTFNIRDDGVRRRLFIASMLHIAGRFLKEAYGLEPKTVKCLYPDSFTKKDVSFADVSKNTIHIIENDYNTRALQVLFHEYGHIYQKMFIPGRLFDGAGHSSGMDLSVNRSKEKGIRQAFIEGHATYFASRVADKYKTLLGKGKMVSDLVLEKMDTTAPYGGEGNEANVYYFLYDLTDGYGAERSLYLADGVVTHQLMMDSEDKIRYSDSEIHSIFKGLKEPNLYNFVCEVLSRHPNDTLKINVLLTMNGIAPCNIRTKKVDKKKDIFEVEWEPGGAETSCTSSGCGDKEKGVCQTNQDECLVNLYAPNELNVVIASSDVVKKKKSYEFKWSNVDYLQDRGYNYVAVKIKGIAPLDPKTEYESTYCCAGFPPFFDGKETLTILPSMFNKYSCKEPKEINIDGIKVKVSWEKVSFDNHFYFDLENASYIRFEFIDKTFNSLDISFVGNIGREEPSYLVTAIDKDGKRFEKYYPEKEIRLATKLNANLGVDGCNFLIQVVNDVEASQIIKRIVFSNRQRLKPIHTGPRETEGLGSSVFVGKNIHDVIEGVVPSGKKPIKAKKK